MDIDGQPLAIDGTVIREGTALYDTTFDRVLWITEIDTHGITVAVADPYRDDAPLWWTPGGDPTLIANGSRLGTTQFRERIETGRFEVGPQP